MGDGSQRIVYIVDDDDGVRDSTSELLRSAGQCVRDFQSGQDFLDDLDPVEGGCIILDLHMPTLSGLQILDILVQRKSTVPVILFTGRSETARSALIQSAGASAILAKPVDADRLIATVTAFVNQTSIPAMKA